MDDRDAGPALLAWLDHHLPNADAAELAAQLRVFRREGLRRRGAARRAFQEAFAARLPPNDRAEARDALAWLFGEKWLPPPIDDIPAVRPVERRLL